MYLQFIQHVVDLLVVELFMKAVEAGFAENIVVMSIVASEHNAILWRGRGEGGQFTSERLSIEYVSTLEQACVGCVNLKWNWL